MVNIVCLQEWEFKIFNSRSICLLGEDETLTGEWHSHFLKMLSLSDENREGLGSYDFFRLGFLDLFPPTTLLSEKILSDPKYTDLFNKYTNETLFFKF